MTRPHALVLGVLLALATGAGVFDVSSTSALRSQALKPQVASAQTLARTSKKLDAWSASLDRALRSHPPALPPVPHYASPVVMSSPVARPAPAVAALPARSAPPRRVARTKGRARPKPLPVATVAQPAATPTASAPVTTAGGGWSGSDHVDDGSDDGADGSDRSDG